MIECELLDIQVQIYYCFNTFGLVYQRKKKRLHTDAVGMLLWFRSSLLFYHTA